MKLFQKIRNSLFVFFGSFLLNTSPSLAAEMCQTFEGPAAWTGECPNGVAQGQGKAIYEDSYISSIEGEMIGGKPNGEVKINYSDGGYYIGEMKDGEPHGYGLSMEAWGEGYHGNWIDGIRDGDGEYISAVERKVAGVWRGGRLVGSWYLDSASECSIWWTAENDPIGLVKWSGECVDGKGHGSGQINWTSDEQDQPVVKSIIFNGNLDSGIIQGPGTWRKIEKYVNVTNEIEYQGNWIDGQRSGAGAEKITTVSNEGYPQIDVQEQYDGEWKYDSYWGVGVYEKRQLGGSERDLMLKEQGVFAAGRLHGEGQREAVRHFSETEKTTEKQSGQFIQGQLGGKGEEIYESSRQGRKYYQRVEGNWSAGGTLEGVAEYADGSKFRGIFFGHRPIPHRGVCDFPSANFSGPCEAFSRDTSDVSGETCLVPEGRKEPCLIVISSWIS